MNLLDDDSSGSEFVPGPEEEDPEEKTALKKRKVEAEVELLEDNELDDLWAQMNGGVSAAASSQNSAKKTATVAKPAPKKPAETVDIDALLKQLESAEKPKTTTEVVKFAGVDVEVEVKANKKSNNISNLIDGLKGKSKKISTIEKSEIDWESHKQKDKTIQVNCFPFIIYFFSNFFFVQDELDKHMKSGTYLEKVSFLKRSELREYEIERDAKKK
jgi:hypothetical protein